MLGFGTLARKVFGTPNDRKVKSVQPLVARINEHPEEYATRSAPCRPTDPALDETDRDQFATELALDYLRAHRDRLPVVVMARVGRMWDLYTPGLGGDEPLGQNVHFNVALEGRGALASRVGLLMWWGLLPTALAGTVLLWRRGVPVSPLVAMAVVITVTAAATFGITRYRVPLDAVAVVAAAAAVDRLLDRWWPDPGGPSLRRRRGRPLSEVMPEPVSGSGAPGGTDDR